MKNHVYTKKLCMTEFHIANVCIDGPMYFDADIGQEHSAFLFISKGTVTLSSAYQHVSAREGELVFIPEGIRYSALWHGTPEIAYYSIRIISKQVDLSNSAAGFALQKVALPQEVNTGAEIAEIYRLFETTDRINMLKGLGLYYCLYSQILPCLKEADTTLYSTAIVTATTYLDEHYAEDFSIETLAAACGISESRLYHMFRDELDTTPTKYRNTLRIERAAADLRIAGLTIEEVAGKNGFHSAAYFRETFKSETGLTPTEYRRMARHSK